MVAIAIFNPLLKMFWRFIDGPKIGPVPGIARKLPKVFSSGEMSLKSRASVGAKRRPAVAPMPKTT
jgi:hypothetical protein